MLDMYNLFKYLKEKENRTIPELVEWKHNINLYYKDKSLIKDKEVLEVLNMAYEWLYDFLTDDLKNLEKRKVGKNTYYDYVYYKDSKAILAYDKKNDNNDIDYDNFYSIFKSYMDSYLNDNKTLELIIQGYLVNTLQMEGSHIFISSYLNLILL